MKIRELIEKLEISQREAARLIGISDRTMRRYCSVNDPDEAPKPVKEGIEKDEAQKVKEQLEAAGAQVDLK